MSGVDGGRQPARAPRDARTPSHEGSERGRQPSAEASNQARRPGGRAASRNRTPRTPSPTSASSASARSPVGTILQPDQTEEDKIQAIMKKVESALERQRLEVDEKLRGMKEELADLAAQLRLLREGGAHDAGPVSQPAGQTALPTQPQTPNILASSTQRAVQITPEMLDCGEVYTINESVWDAMIFWGHDALGPLNSAIVGMSYLVNIVLQALFIYMVHAIMMEEEMSPEILDGLLKFRLSLAHSVDYADKVTQRSMAAQICNRERKLHLAGEQFNLFGELYDFVENGAWGICLVWFIQLLWLCTILRDIDNTYSICDATMKVKKGRRTRLVLADLRDEDDEETSPTRSDRRERPETAAAGWDDDDLHNPGEELGGFMCVVRMITMRTSRKALVQVCVCVPKVALAVALYIIGAAWLANTISFSDLILNGVALAFVLEFDEVLYAVLVPRRAKTLISNLEPLPLRPRIPGTRWSGVCNIGVVLLCAPILYWVYHEYLQKRWWQLKQGHDIVCEGRLDFIYTVNPATGMVHFAATTGEDSYTDTEKIVAQVAKPPLEDHEWWDDVVSSAVFEASASDFDRAVEESGSDSFDQIVKMSVWSTAEAAAALPCEDLRSGQSINASVRALQELTQDPAITGCSDIPAERCALLASTELRAICPRHCRCEETLLSYVGFFQRPEYGCPSQCEYFKAAKNEIDFRFELTKIDTSSSRRLQFNESNDTVLFSSASSLGCSDLASTGFGFAGGCADSDGETFLDRNGDDCSIYEADPWKCGGADDDDFVATELCCSCGGGYADVPSSVDCYDNFTELCWRMPETSLRWLMYVRGLFEYSQSNPGFRDSVASVVEMDYAGIDPDTQTKEDLIEHIASGEMMRALANGTWDLMPGLPHPRGLTGCAYLHSYEVTSLLNIDLCAEGVHTPIRFFCPSACGCSSSNGLEECPAACILTDCLDGLDNGTCGHVHPWYSTECTAGFHNDGGKPTCFKCTEGETRRRRSTECTDCANGFYDVGNFDVCVQCLGGATRRRRSDSCTDCGPGTYDVDDSDDCTKCVGGATRRRRSTACTGCLLGSYNDGSGDDCQDTLGCSTTRRRSSTCSVCSNGTYNDGTSDECMECEGGEIRRRRADACTPCPSGTRDDGAYDDCVDVDCPAYSSGDNVRDGCTCSTGFIGTIRAASTAPSYTGECKNLSFHVITDGMCVVPILDPQLCLFGSRLLGLTTSDVVTEVDYVLSRYACDVYIAGGADIPNVNTVGTTECLSDAPCVCLGSEDDIACGDSPDTDDCPPSIQEDWNSWNAYCNEGGGDPTKCCNCWPDGGVNTKQFDSTCQDTSGGAVSDLQVAYGLFDGCIKWDWFPDTCQWSSYYDDDDFTAASMCCACGGGIFTTTMTATSSTTQHSTTETSNTKTSNTETSNTESSKTNTETTTSLSSTTHHSTTETSNTESSTTAHTTTAVFPRESIRVAVGYDRTLVVADDETVWASGSDSGTTFAQMSDENWVSAAAGGVSNYDSHYSVLSRDGALWTGGDGLYGKLGNGLTSGDSDLTQVLSGVQAVAMGAFLTAVVMQDGTVWTAGYSIVGDDTWTERATFAQVSSSGSYVSGVQAVSAGPYHIAILGVTGSVSTASVEYYGYYRGQLGDGSNVGRSSFEVVVEDVQAVSLGASHSAVLKTDGTVWTCGYGYYGALGDSQSYWSYSSYSYRTTFEQVMTNAQAVGSGEDHTAVLKSDGTVWTSGRGWYGALGNGVSSDRNYFEQVMSNAQAIATGSGSRHTVVLLEDGLVWATGYNIAGQLGNGGTSTAYTFAEVFDMGTGPTVT